MLDTPFPPWPSFTEEEAAAVSSVLLSNRVNYWTGRECQEFEREFAIWAQAEHGISLFNGTIALEVALRAIGIGQGDEVVVTPRSFMASASSVVFTGGTPVFADVDRDTQNVTADTIAAVITPRTRALLVVHLAGMPCDMDPIMDLAQRQGIHVIEDCAQAHGARYRGRSVGSIGSIGAWSFCQDKIMTTGGEGGFVTTRDQELWDRMWSDKDHGKSFDAVHKRHHEPGFRWVHESFGTNGRMIEMQAAIGRIQLRRMEEWHRMRLRHAEAIWSVASGLPGLRVPAIPDYAEHAAYRAYLFVEPKALRSGWNRDRVLSTIVDRGVPCFTGTCPEIYRERAFDGTGYRPAAPLPIARELGESSLCFLVHPTLQQTHIDQTCDVISDVMKEAVR